MRGPDCSLLNMNKNEWVNREHYVGAPGEERQQQQQQQNN